jgi:putative transposase
VAQAPLVYRQDDQDDAEIDVSKVIPLPVFDARKEAKLWRL